MKHSIQNFFTSLSNSHPRIWAILVFIPFLFGTVVLFPIGVAIDVLSDVPRIVENLWSDIRSAFGRSSSAVRLLHEMWSLWYAKISN